MNGVRGPGVGRQHMDHFQHSQTLLQQLKTLSKQHDEVLAAYERRLSTLQAEVAQHPVRASAAPGKRPAPPPAVPEGPEQKRQRIVVEREQRKRQIWDDCAKIVEKLKRHSKAEPFRIPVDPIKLKIPDYFDIIKRPMDLSTVLKNVKLREYKSPQEFAADVRLIWENCRTYNPPNTNVAKHGVAVSEAWEKLWATNEIDKRWAVAMAKEKKEDQVGYGVFTLLCGAYGPRVHAYCQQRLEKRL